MDITQRIDIILNESTFAIRGKEKSSIWKDIRDKILKAKSKDILTKLMKMMEQAHKKGKLGMDEFMDLIDKVDQKTIKIGG